MHNNPSAALLFKNTWMYLLHLEGKPTSFWYNVMCCIHYIPFFVFIQAVVYCSFVLWFIHCFINSFILYIDEIFFNVKYWECHCVRFWLFLCGWQLNMIYGNQSPLVLPTRWSCARIFLFTRCIPTARAWFISTYVRPFLSDHPTKFSSCRLHDQVWANLGSRCCVLHV